MPDSASRLPPRPSLEHLRKQAKELLAELRSTRPDAVLADAQLALARKHGFESWPRLVHHVESVRSADRIAMFEQLAADLLAGHGGDAGALERLGAHYGDSSSNEQRLVKVRQLLDPSGSASEPTLERARTVIAKQYGFDSWHGLAQGLAQPPAGADSRLGLSASPPFYKLDAKRNRIVPRPPLSDRDWDAIFAIMAERRITGIESSAMTDSVLERLSRLDFVRSIGLDGAQRLSDDGLLHLARIPQLEELNVSGYHSPVTDRGLAVLRHLTGLRRFQMTWPQRLSDAGVANLAFCDHLESVDLMGTPTGDGAIHALVGKKKLRRFKTGRLVTDAGIPLLHRFPAFTTWEALPAEYGLMSSEPEGTTSLMLDGPFSDKGLAAVAGLDGIFGLNLFWHVSGLTPNGLAALKDMAHLGFLGCDGKLCDDTAMRHIAAIPDLRVLMAQGTVAGDDGFVALSRSRTIEHIWGRECPNLRSRGFAALAAMPALRGLAVSCKLVDDDALSTLPRYPALTQLTPIDVSDDGFRHVGKCERLEKLWCMYCRDTGDVATGHIAGLSRLELYYAGQTRITDVSLEVLSRMDSLQKIELWNVAGVTDRGVAHLARLPRLREIDLDCPNVTRASAALFPAQVRVNYPG